MSVTSPDAGSDHSRDWLEQARRIAWARLLRLISGSILFVFLTLHLLNHAAGLFGLAALDFVQIWRWKIQMNPVGVALIYGSFLVHISLGLARVASRKTMRMPVQELAQVISGVLIPILLIPHLVHTRVAGTWFGGNGFYETVLQGLWPDHAIWQISLVILAWFHGVLGLTMAFRHRPWFSSVRRAGFVLALIIPTLAIAGFISAGREVAFKPKPPQAADHHEMLRLEMIGSLSYFAIGALLLGVAGILQITYLRRRLGAQVSVTYRGRGPVAVPLGLSILDASRINGIAHPSICGGKGRCSTCRVQILSDLSTLPEPETIERATLDRIGSPPNVRLACQLRPGRDVTIRILVPVLGKDFDGASIADAERWAVEREATVLVLDIRAFERILESKQPYELAAMVNRFSQEMHQAVQNHGGTVTTFVGDGLIAVFDEGDRPSAGAGRALAAARDMSRVMKLLNREMGNALPIPIRAGIGIHTGPVTLARIGETETSSVLMAFGETVSIASSLQEATKHTVTDCLISALAARHARLDTTGLRLVDIDIDRRNAVLSAFALGERQLVKAARRSNPSDLAEEREA